jgi:hypothetical protein
MREIRAPGGNFYFGALIFPKMLASGGEGVGLKFFSGFKNRSKNLSRQTPVRLSFKKIFPDKFLLKHG